MVWVIAWPLASHAQQPKQPLKSVGFLTFTVPCPLQPDHPVVRRLGELGWIEGQHFYFECESTVDRVDQLSSTRAPARCSFRTGRSTRMRPSSSLPKP